jgi:7-carboxy-7-deazaguanine synthase
MFGNNKIMPCDNGFDGNLAIQEIFHTIQGEGPFSGQPAIFIRTGGCNLACDFCDTEFDSHKKMTIDEILAIVNQLSRSSITNEKIVKLIVITGGEPMRQSISELCYQLINLDFKIQIETNGTIFRDLPLEVAIICSPKVSNGKYHKIRSDLLPRIAAFKFIVAKHHQYYQYLPEFINDIKVPIYIQPMDQYDAKKNLENQQYALDLSIKFGYFLSLQIHKILNIP